MIGVGMMHVPESKNPVTKKWLRRIAGRRLVTIELGAGLAVPTVRFKCESRASTLIRINPREADAAPGAVSIRLGALEALNRIADEPSMQKRCSG